MECEPRDPAEDVQRPRIRSSGGRQVRESSQNRPRWVGRVNLAIWDQISHVKCKCKDEKLLKRCAEEMPARSERDCFSLVVSQFL